MQFSFPLRKSSRETFVLSDFWNEMHACRILLGFPTIILKQIRWFCKDNFGYMYGMEMDRECKCVLDYVWPSLVGEKWQASVTFGCTIVLCSDLYSVQHSTLSVSKKGKIFMTSPTRVIWTVLYLPEELIYEKVLQRRIEFLLFSLYTEHLPLTFRTITWLQLYSCNTPKRRWKPEKGAAAWSIKNVMYATKAAGDFFMVFVVIMKVVERGYTFQIDHRWMHFLQSDMRGISIRARKQRKIWPWKGHEKIVCLLLQLLLWVGAGGRPRSCFGLSVVLSGYISALWLMICGHETTSRQPSRRIRHTKLIFWDVITLLGNRVATFLSSLLWSSNKRVGFNNRLIECHTIRGLYTRAKEALSFFY